MLSTTLQMKETWFSAVALSICLHRHTLGDPPSLRRNGCKDVPSVKLLTGPTAFNRSKDNNLWQISHLERQNNLVTSTAREKFLLAKIRWLHKNHAIATWSFESISGSA
jgi:hypothetical protein